MDFYDLLKKASLNQKKAEKELENNKRYSLNFAPMKKIERPKVSKEAVAARLKKKEEEEKKKAEIEEKKRQAVLALRAEQEAAKSSKRHKDSSSADLSHRKKEKVSEEQKKIDRRAKREDWYQKQLEEKSSSEDEEENYAQKARTVQSEPDVKQKPKALSFKELMALAASNAKGEKPEEKQETQSNKNEVGNNNLKLKSHTIKGETKDRGENHKVSKVVTNKTSIGNNVQKSIDRVKSSHKINNSVSKSSGRDQGRKSTFFPNTKSHTSSTPSIKDTVRHSEASPKPDRSSKSVASDTKRTPSGYHSNEMRKNNGDKRKIIGGNQHQTKDRVGLSHHKNESSGVESHASQKSHQSTKRNGGWLEPVKKAPPVTKQPVKASQNSPYPTKRKDGQLDQAGETPGASKKSHHPTKRKGGWLDPVEKSPTVTKQTGDASERSHHPAKRKCGWLDPSEKSPPVPKQNGQASEKSYHPVKRKGGWLDPAEKPPPVAKQMGHASDKSSHPAKRKGGWLDPVREPSVNSGHIPKTSKDNSKHLKESIERKGGLAEGSKVSKDDRVQGTSSKNKVLHSQSKEKKSLVTPSSSAKVTPQGQAKKRGWLDRVEGRVPSINEERGGGGWLGPVKSQKHLGPQKRVGGWLGSAGEPSFAAKRGRLLSSEDEEEDSDLDGFIDDTPLEDEGTDVSSYIKEIFGYDKSKYGYESDYALRSMDASYSQILKEEARSARIAMKEDAEELRKEQEREKMKKLARSKKK